jgi:acetyl-CoA synthetase
MFEGVPTYPDAGRFWKIIQDHKVNVFYTAPTAIRSLIKAGGDLPKKYDLSSLRILGTVGEPINPEAWMWYHTTVGNSRCPIVDTWWQTETGGHLISPLPARLHETRLGNASAARHHCRHRRRGRPFGRPRQGRASSSSSARGRR